MDKNIFENDMTRHYGILDAIADKLMNQESIGDVLHELNVSIDELSVFTTAGMILKGFLKLNVDDQAKLAILGAELPDELAKDVLSTIRINELEKKLKNA